MHELECRYLWMFSFAFWWRENQTYLLVMELLSCFSISRFHRFTVATPWSNDSCILESSGYCVLKRERFGRQKITKFVTVIGNRSYAISNSLQPVFDGSIWQMQRQAEQARIPQLLLAYSRFNLEPTEQH